MARKSSDKRETPTRHRDFLICVCLVIVTLWAYWPVGNHEFTSFDDNEYITENRYVQSGLRAENIAWAFTSAHAVNWHPLTWISHMVDCQFFGLNAGRHHLTNLFLHCANTLLLFFVLTKMTRERWPSACVAALFALHPLHVESVAWIAERKDVLSTLFWMLTTWAYLSYVERPKPGKYLLVLLFFMLGLMAKPMLVTLPCVLLLLDYWPLRRIQFGHSTKRGTPDQTPLSRLIGEKIPLFALAAISSAVTLLVQQSGGAVRSLINYPFSARIANALITYCAYIGKMFWPFNLAVFYPYPDRVTAWQVGGACIALIAVSAFAVKTIRSHPYVAVGWLWYLGTLVPVIGVIQVGAQAMADRYTYIPLIGIFMILAWAAPELLARWRHAKRVFATAAPMLLLVLLALTRLQVGVWADSTSLFQHAIDNTSDNWRAHNHLAIAMAEQGKIDDAIRHYSEALRIEPDYVAAHVNLGAVLAERGELDEAIRHYSEALRIDPDYLAAHVNLGVALVGQRNYDAAIEHYEEALRIEPDNPVVYFNMGVALAGKKRIDDAVRHYAEAVRINPDYVNAHFNLGVSYHTQGKIEDAVRHYRETLRLDPHNAAVHNNLGFALAMQGQIDDAIAHYSQALRIDPTHANARRNLDTILAHRKRSMGKVE